MPDGQPRSVAVAAENLLAVTGQSPMATDGWDLNKYIPLPAWLLPMGTRRSRTARFGALDPPCGPA